MRLCEDFRKQRTYPAKLSDKICDDVFFSNKRMYHEQEAVISEKDMTASFLALLY